MQVEYSSSERVWRSPDLGINYTGLGKAILTKLKEDNPNRVLEVHCDIGAQLTVDYVRCQTITVAQNLMQLGVGNGDTVILYSMVNEKVTPITFACYTIGAPINFFETKFEGDEITHTLELVDPTIIIYEDEYKPQLLTALKHAKLPKLKYVLSMDFESTSSIEVLFKPVANLDDFQPPDIGDPTMVPATLMLTSGSTGFPKVIQHSHAMMMLGLYSWWDIEPNSKLFCFSPLRWISQVSLMMQSVFFGAQRFYASKQPAGAYGKDIIDVFKITHFFTVPKIYQDVLKVAEQQQNSSSLSSLKTVLIGGEVIPNSLVAFSEKIAPKCKFVKCYGMTELAGGIASDEGISNSDVNGGVLKSGLIAKVIDEDGKSLGPNEMGRLCLKSTVPYLGYLKNEEANKENFIEDGWLNTGDYGCMTSDNLLNVITRYKYLVRANGRIIVPTFVENTMNSHPNVLSSALVGYPSPKNPHDEVGIVFVILRGSAISENIENELQEFLRQKLTKEQLQVVRHVKVISEMPLTTCSKVNRIALKEIAKRG